MHEYSLSPALTQILDLGLYDPELLAYLPELFDFSESIIHTPDSYEGD